MTALRSECKVELDRKAVIQILVSPQQTSGTGKQDRHPSLVALLRLLDEHAFARLSGHELRLGSWCKRLSDRARQAADDGDGAACCEALALASSLAERRDLSHEASVLLTAEIEPATSYVEQVNASWDTARLHLVRALEADQVLEDQFGYVWKIAHRLHLLTSAATMSLEQGEAEDAAAKVSAVLSILSNGPVDVREPGDWASSRLQCLPEGMDQLLAKRALHVLFRLLSCLCGEARLLIVAPVLAILNCSSVLFSRTDISYYAGVLQAALYEHARYGALCAQLVQRQPRIPVSIRYAMAFDLSCLWAEDSDGDLNTARMLLSTQRQYPPLFPVRKHWAARLHTASRSN